MTSAGENTPPPMRPPSVIATANALTTANMTAWPRPIWPDSAAAVGS